MVMSTFHGVNIGINFPNLWKNDSFYVQYIWWNTLTCFYSFRPLFRLKSLWKTWHIGPFDLIIVTRQKCHLLKNIDGYFDTPAVWSFGVDYQVYKTWAWGLDHPVRRVSKISEQVFVNVRTVLTKRARLLFPMFPKYVVVTSMCDSIPKMVKPSMHRVCVMESFWS